jgi:hypothetical protein
LVGVSEDLLDFGFAPAGKTSDFKDFFFYNRNMFPVVLLWPEVEGACFEVRPPKLEVGAGESVTLKAYFKPNTLAAYYYTRLHCLIYARVHRHGLDDIGRMSMTGPEVVGTIPPFSLNVPMSGHSFPATTQPFIPMVNVNPKGRLVFPPCFTGETTFQTIQIRNTNDTPVFFKVI